MDERRIQVFFFDTDKRGLSNQNTKKCENSVKLK